MLEVLAKDMGSLLRDLEYLEQDLTCLEEGIRVVYAPDFSEIYSYYNHEETLEEFRVFSDDNSIECSVAQSRAMDRLLKPKDFSITLLPSYEIELSHWTSTAKNRAQFEIAELADLAFAELKELVSKTSFLRIVNIAEFSDSLSDEDKHEILNYFSSEAGSIIALLTRASLDTFEKINVIFQQEAFISAHSLSLDQSSSDEIYKDWLSGLQSLRSRGDALFSIANDALAVAQVHSFNSCSDDVKIRIVTRSDSMNSYFDQSDTLHEWDKCNGNPIRHPRIFSFLHGINLQDTREALKQVSDMKKSIQIFLMSYSELTHEEGSNKTDLEIEKIKSLWHQSSQASTSLVGLDQEIFDNQVNSEGASRQIEELQKLFKHLSNRNSLRSLLVDHISTLISRVEIEYQTLAWSVQVSEDAEAETLRENIEIQIKESEVHLYSLHFRIPYPLVCRSNLAFKLGSRIEQKGTFSIAEVSSWLSESSDDTDAESIYERVLIIGYFFATWGKWKIANSYFGAALNSFDRRSKITATEARFFLAVCSARQPDYKGNSIKAIAVLESLLLSEAENDIRVHSEISSLLFKVGEPGKRDKPISHALKVLELANDQELTLKILQANNLCYHYLCAGENSNAREYFELLKHLVNQVNDARLKLWPGVTDTLLYGRWVLERDEISDSERKSMLEKLEPLKNMKGFLKLSVQDIEQHIIEISTLDE